MAQRSAVTGQKQSNVLIIDDDYNTCEMLAGLLSSRGYAASIAHEGPLAIEKMRSSHFDLVLIDVMMPGMNGLEALRELKQLHPGAITIIISGNSQVEETMRSTLWAGVDGVLHKPLDPSAVLELLERSAKEKSDAPFIELKGYEVDPAAIKLVPEDMARKFMVLPLKVEGGLLVVAMADPSNLYAIEDLRVRTSLGIRPLRAEAAEIDAAITAHYHSTGEIERQIERISPALSVQEDRLAERLSAELVSQTPVVRAVELMLRQAVKDKASDIHLEPQDDYLRVRFRIDGVLHDTMRLPARVHAPLISRIKVLSNLNIAERRRPQDGQFSVTVDGSSVDFRVATVDTVRGEMVVMRVLDKSVSVRPLPDLGFLPDMCETYERILNSPWGIVLIAGPTGSGKTSTLYASLNQLDKNESKIITIEDPVEYRFGGMAQLQVNRQAGITFASGLRAAMRLDPDVILVGEIRDQETASIAVQASLTGHLVFSSIHANDTTGAILRLVDLGIEPFLVTSSLLAVLSQRLVRRICPKCAAEKEVDAPERLAYQQETGEERSTFLYGQGCSNCAGTGYRGRLAAFELLTMNDIIRRMVLQGAHSDEIRATAVEMGMRSMRHDGMLKAARGMTTPIEILRKVFTMS